MKNNKQSDLILLFEKSKPSHECTGQSVSLKQFWKAPMYILSIEVSQQSHGLGRNFQNHYVYHKSKHFSLCVLLVEW